MKPLSQFERPSMTKVSTTSTLKIITAVFIAPKTKSIGWSITHPITTVNGTTKSAICVEEPTAMPMDSPGRSCNAKRMALACSQALPAKGKTMMPMKLAGIFPWPTTSSMAPTSISEHTAMKHVVTAMRTNEHFPDKPPPSSPSSSSSSSSPFASATAAAGAAAARAAAGAASSSASSSPTAADFFFFFFFFLPPAVAPCPSSVASSASSSSTAGSSAASRAAAASVAAVSTAASRATSSSAPAAAPPPDFFFFAGICRTAGN
mmetsp:Transcript_91135/g.256886  ORF Transcript_91135/g.256886 Transcript_91135/m.256886 type:complete len:263 (-) Transcript_91135:88-876(-)